MDFGGNMFCLSNGDREQNGNSNSTSFAWDSWEPTTSTHSSLINSFYTAAATAAAENSTPNRQEASLANAVMFLPQASASDHHHDDGGVHHHQQPLYTGDGSHVHLDPHLMCLKLGKRHYFEDANAPSLGGSTGGHGGFTLAAGKRGKGHYGSSASGGGGGASAGSVKAAATVPRCQVEGCHVALLNAKDYHRRHKVCEMHSKAPKVVVLGLEQRFCQQCSRFHLVSEFDDSKRSCRRRLAGHNERRRKSFHDSVGRNSSQDNKLMVGGFPYLSSLSSSSGCAHSLLSSKSNSWLSPSDLSTRCSAALLELIAENRAAIMAKQINLDRDWHLQHHQAVDEEELKDIQPQSNYFLQQQQMFP